MPAVVILCCILVPFFSSVAWGSTYQPQQISARNTLAAFETIPGLSQQELTYGKQSISQLHYNAQRVLRKICTLQGVRFYHAQQAIQFLRAQRFTYEQARSFEALCDIGPMLADSGLAALPKIRTLSFVSGRAFRSYTKVENITPNQALNTIPLFNNMADPNNNAAQAFFTIQGMNVTMALEGLRTLIRLQEKQARAAEAFARIMDMNPATMLQALGTIVKLPRNDAWNARCLFAQQGMRGQEAWNWLITYFALPANIQETQYMQLDNRKKSTLLQALYDGGTGPIWRINNLHAITDGNGYEISQSTLNSYSKSQLQAHFNLLEPQVQARFGAQFRKAGRNQAITLLKQATSAARVQAARNLSTANAYAVLAQGSELYDSSFRNILVPIFAKRIQEKTGGDLLRFLQIYDPESKLVSNFISSCAQKGKLTVFFPQDGQKQRAILSLVAISAFQDQDSILLFSATMNHLLKVLTPESRTYLLGLMAQETEMDNSLFSKLINVTLQYYLQTYPELLGQNDRNAIVRLMVRNGAINLDRYQVTPFAQWKEDGRLASVSMFHPDDDGRQSFISNANLLLKNGYRLVPSQQYTIATMSPALEAQIRQYASGGLPQLFKAMRDRHFAIAFIKNLGGITICHTQFVYSSKENQMQMLTRFIRSGDEMLAQRGHSYWRSEQIIEPLTKLLKDKRITAQELSGKQRFLSLGSCGGVKAYTNLTELFYGSVDILATIGTGLALINDPYNKQFFEIIATNPASITWKTISQKSAFIFQGGKGQDYLQPGSLTSILHKIINETQGPTGFSPNSLRLNQE